MEGSSKFGCFLIFFIIIAVEGNRYPRITVPEGEIEGYYKTAHNGKTFAAFEGIPYAKPPVGELRFQEPQPVTEWRGIWIANQTVKCLQHSHFGYETVGQEDCLYLNIYTPAKIIWTEPLDVIVHIHGGAFMFGTGHVWGPEILLENRVIYITINYRLGPLGFLSTEDSVCPGNNGLKDQAVALRWIKDKIAHFGGNPNSITLTGMSAGGASVTYHYMSSWSKNLFTRGFAQSGSALNPWAFSENNLEKAKILGNSVGCYDDTTKELINCLRTRPAQNIVSNVKKFLGYLYNPFSPFGPTIEKGGNNPFLAEAPYKLMKEGKIQDIPIIFSVSQAEGLYPAGEFISNQRYLSDINNKWFSLAPHLLDFNFTVPEHRRDEVSRNIRRYYLKDKAISTENFVPFVQIFTDRLFIATIEETIRLFINAIKSPVYFQYFNYRGEYSFSQKISHVNANLGVSHCDDSMYVLPFTYTPPLKSKDSQKMTEIMTHLWLTFAKTSVPKIAGVDYRPVKIQNGNFNYLDIEHPNKISMKSSKSLSNFEFWNSVPFKENNNLNLILL
ncbi:venom carboxylesterase-6-like isoform X2 [Chrysoperla carnea]|uniref:venom carboxylesterase-6-like isoform X2 n=1 Tax=Chrysoperla carnea TaxID=189513 RepID=UPI001D098021|nr:venom carboxylesterase-6-like isoform X2 [Chrysoperla carnea]